MRIQVITGTTRENRFSERVAEWVTGTCRLATTSRSSRSTCVTTRCRSSRERRPGSPRVRDRRGRPVRADHRPGRRLLVLTAEYNHGYPAVLKNAMDWTFVEWRRKPITFVGWGNVGGARAIEQLREVAVEFEMAPLRYAVHVLPDVMIPLLTVEDPTDSPRSPHSSPGSTCWPTTSSGGRRP